MNPEEPQVDALVRAYLREIEDTVDTPRIVERIMAEVSPAKSTAASSSVVPGASPLRASGKQRWSRWVWALASAAAVLLVGLLVMQVGKAQASAEAYVSGARQVHALPVDRCYLMQVELPPEIRQEFAFLGPEPRALAWTRGDQYCIRPADPDKRWRLGRDTEGRTWIALPPNLGLRFDPQEIPRWRTIGMDFCGLELGTLLKDVLTDFDIHWESPSPNSWPETRVIRADLKPGRTHPTLRDVVLEIDPETKVVRRVVMTRLFHHPAPFAATLAATLIDSSPQNDAQYRLEGHLKPDARILDSDQAEQRRALLDTLRQRREGP